MAMERSRLKGQVAVVTGGGRGIGRTIALLLAAAGASVAVFARTASGVTETAELIKQASGQSKAFALDVTDSQTVARKIAEIEGSLGPVDLLVNNAATVGPICPLWESGLEDWWRVMDVNLRGPVLCSHAVLPGMISRKRGRIVNIVNSATPLPYLSSYMTSKTALVRLTEIVAAETKEYGISLFSLAPGTVRTAMSERSLHSAEAQTWMPWFRRIFDEGLNVPAERPAQFVVELASGRADALSGRLLSVSDDLDALLEDVKQIEKDNLLSLRVRTLNPVNTNPALASILGEAERTARYLLRIEYTFEASRASVFHPPEFCCRNDCQPMNRAFGMSATLSRR
jgi:NAD(P)-dependent dehydrogenase (short-subunit alcohol dehydrogenase family)